MTDSRPKMRQIILWRIEAWLYDFADFLARLFPIDAVSDMGAGLAGALGPLTSAHRVAETNLRIAFPEASDGEIGRLLKAQWDQFGRWAFEFLILDRIIAEPDRG